jgi:hypothetical protein
MDYTNFYCFSRAFAAIILYGRKIHADLPCATLFTDPKYEEEVSGCTACVSLIAGNKIYVVCSPYQ